MKRAVLAAMRVLFALAWSAAAFAEELKPLAVTSVDNGKSVAVKTGQAVVVSLRGNPTTGYSWALAGIDGKSVALDGKIEYQEDPHLDARVGVPGMFEARFKTLEPGSSTVRLEYRRPWEKNQKPAKTFQVTLAVEK